MAKNFIISALWGAVLGLILPFAAASAGPCDGRKPCDAAPPGLYERDRSIERRLEREFFRTQDLQRGVAKNRRKARRSIEIYSPRGDDDDQFVQNYGEGDSLIGPTEALNQALAAVPGGKALGVKLLKGPTPVYAVRLRVRGRVRQIFVDARTAQVLGE
jgi:uncharacterized membrane protein YkoI